MASSDIGGSLNVHESQREAIDLPLFSFSTIANATANFSPDNKLGEGGFGSVYKGNDIYTYVFTSSREDLDAFTFVHVGIIIRVQYYKFFSLAYYKVL
ncbi:concanavalin A-like lectin/glucanase domain, Serine/threonine-protein kinase pim-1/2/3 [Artemisia annua]|uniref:Concanavalin A-like lectin/glucanase domain, Serine/threonine-protein kinase pim-1/2/3 n=1 Tax=Artemisia annua TaxID=35608 RepID=A0A2U1LAE6_ARTAN|nr:concanavalin A-like lectin/glucanase domain, Serine/threonine-protein kinase pim-1/2/3 [Artemisia annua]